MRGTDIIRSNRKQSTSVPRRDMSREYTGAGPVISRLLTPEELQAVIQQYGAPVQPLHRAPSQTAPGQGLARPKQRQTPGRKTIPEPDKRAILQRIAAGETIRSIEKSMNVSEGRLYTWIRKWQLVGITPEQARAILTQQEEDYGS